MTVAYQMTGPGDLRDQRWLDDRIAAIEDGIEAVIDIARNWTAGRNLSRLHPGVSAKDYILARVQHPLGPGVIVPLLAESNWTNVEIAAIAGVTEGAVRYHETRSNYEFDRTERLLSDGSVRTYEPRVVQAVVIDEPMDEEIDLDAGPDEGARRDAYRRALSDYIAGIVRVQPPTLGDPPSTYRRRHELERRLQAVLAEVMS